MIVLKPASRMLLVVGLAPILLNACSLLADSQHPEGFASYAESVFRRQNQLSSRLMMLNDADMLPDSESFEATEHQMDHACHMLNEYAEHEADGEAMSLGFQSKVQDSIEGCDQSIERMEALLNSLGMGTPPKKP